MRSVNVVFPESMWAEMPMLRRLMSSRSVANCLAQDEVAGARPDRGPLPVGIGWAVRRNPLRLDEANELDAPPRVPPRRRSIVVAMVTISFRGSTVYVESDERNKTK